MSSRFLLSLIVVMALAACGGGGDSSQDQATPAVSNKPIVIAHRGASGYLPEHTLGSYELAIRMKADYIEPDLQFTSDKQLVAMHDESLDRTTNVATVFPGLRNGHSKYLVSDFTLSEIKQLTVLPTGTASNSHPGFTPSMADPFKVPTFDEVLAFIKAQGEKLKRPIGVYPEAKQADPAMEDAILQALARHGLNRPESPVFVQSFSEGTIRSLHAKQTTQGTGAQLIVLGAATMQAGVAKFVAFTDTGMTTIDLADLSKFAAGVGVIIDYPAFALTREFVSQARAAGLKVHGWTFDKVDAIAANDQYHRYLSMGVDGLFTNYVDLAVLARDSYLAAP